MITKLTNPVTRETFAHVMNGKYRGKQLIVTLCPPDVLEIRIKGTRQTFHVPIGACLNLAMIIESAHLYSEAKSLYEQKKKAGFKNLRRPKKSQYPFSKMYFKSL